MASVKLKLRQWLVSLDRAAMMGFGRAYLEFSSPSGIDRSGSEKSKEPYVPAKLSGFHPEFVPVNGMEDCAFRSMVSMKKGIKWALFVRG